MSRESRYFFSGAETRQIKATLKRLQIAAKEIAEQLKVDETLFSRILKGERGFTSNFARDFYNAPNQDAALKFLSAYAENDEVELAWLRLYDSYTDRLREIFSHQQPDRRTRLLGELEKILNTYKNG